ncbi:ribosome maturation factor RimM [Legionella fairfieldensis]|uniref:ribosome maturation factor RimM n=1 Tax=Legionella fairfieldensis TaxID=45064 RepID=UPI00048F921F|nr:ribosome maturation factor RimM [Legionella fairfieldensis]
MNKNTEWVIVGRFGRVHGVKGFITVHSFTEPRDNILRYSDWHIYLDKQWQPLHVLHVEVNDKSILAQVEGYCEREQVADLTNVEIAISRNQLPSLKHGEYYWYQLMGMQVMNQHGQLLGNITGIMPTGANDVLIVEGEKRYLIPYLPSQFVLDVDTSQGIITVDWDVDF